MFYKYVVWSREREERERKEVFPFSFLPDIFLLCAGWENEKFLLLLLL